MRKNTEESAISKIDEARRTGATELDLSFMELTSVPESVGNLIGLTTLALNDNKLTVAPRWLVRLTGLNTLYLHHNKLTVAPRWLGQLTGLTNLSLSGNRLATVPESIGQLTGLTILYLHSNRLTSLPESIGQLTGLTTLSLADNKLASLPESIGDLTGLTELALSHNQLTSIPESIQKLSGLKELVLHGNEALGLPPEVLGPSVIEQVDGKPAADPQAILRFYFASRQKRRPLAEAKVLVVGQGSVGKTSLIKYWRCGNGCDGTEEKTTNIDITRTTLAVPCPDGTNTLDVTLNVWDFGGQEIYHATHQFFLSKRSLYLLVLDARLTEDQNNVHYWFQMVRSFGGESRVLVVMNKSEQHRLELNETPLRREYGEQFAGVVRVSCKTPFGRDELTDEIRKQLASMKDVFNEVPEPYFVVKAELEKKARKENFLAYDSYTRLCNKHELKEAIDQTTLIRFLHDLGVVLSFDDPDSPYRLQETTILSPEWVTDGVYAIINSNQLMQKQGVLTRDDFNGILADKEYPPARKPVIIGMMHKFELCFDFPGEEGKRWLVPELLSVKEPDLDWREHESLNFQYHYDVLPGGLMCRFIVRTHGYLTKNPTYWRSGVVLEIDGQRTLVRGDTARGRVFITVQGPPNGRRSALGVVRHVFRAIHATMPGLNVVEKIPLRDNPDVVADFKHLLRLEVARQTEFWPEGASRLYTLSELLDGVTTPKERSEERQRGDIHNHFHKEATVNQNSGNNSGNVKIGTNTGSIVLNWGTLSGTVTSIVKQLPAKREDGPDLKAVIGAFLAALKEAAEKQDLPEAETKDAIEEVEVIAEAAKQPTEPKMLEKANKAVRGLGRIVGGVSALATQAQALGEAVTGWFTG